MERSERIISIAFEGMHRVGKGTQIEVLKERLAQLGIPSVDIRGEGSRAGIGEKSGDPKSEWWLMLTEALHKKEGKEDTSKWDDAAYRLARELIVWRDRFLVRKTQEAQAPFGALIIDRSLLSRAAFIKHRIQPPPEKIFSSEDLYPSDKQHRKKITVDMVLPDIIIELVAPKDVLIERLDTNDPRYDFRKKNIEEMYETYMSTKTHLMPEIQERIVTIDSSRDQETIFADIEKVIQQRFPELLIASDASPKDIIVSEDQSEDPEISQENIDSFLKENIGEIENVEPVSGGLVHRVFRAKSKDSEYYLKVRGSHFAGIPTIDCSPKDIRYEEKALRLASAVSPDTFPRVIAEKTDKGMLLITSIMKPEDNFLLRLRDRTIEEDDLATIGKTLRDIHDQLGLITEAIREDNDDKYYKDNLLYRLGSQKNVILDSTIQELSSRKRQLILGDLSPKNLGLVSGGLRICDLDTTHRGNPIFDIGFFIGHLYAHSLEREYCIANFVEKFLAAYRFIEHMENPLDNSVLQRIVFGTLLYRLRNNIVPYPLEITDQEKTKIVSETEDLLHQDQLTWKTIEYQLRNAKSH